MCLSPYLFVSVCLWALLPEIKLIDWLIKCTKAGNCSHINFSFVWVYLKCTLILLVKIAIDRQSRRRRLTWLIAAAGHKAEISRAARNGADISNARKAQTAKRQVTSLQCNVQSFTTIVRRPDGTSENVIDNNIHYAQSHAVPAHGAGPASCPLQRHYTRRDYSLDNILL